MNWLAELLDEYPNSDNKNNPNNRSDKALARLRSAFANESPAVMEMAVIEYMKKGKYFPKINELYPFVKEAKTNHNTWGTHWAELLEAAKQSGDYSKMDEIMLEWEIGRGEMPVNAGERSYWSVVVDDLINEKMTNKENLTVRLEIAEVPA